MPLFPVPFVSDAKPYAGSAAGEAGFLLSQSDGVWVLDAPDAAAVVVFQAWYNGFDDIAYAKARAKERLNEELSRRINAAEVQGFQLTQIIRVLRLQVKNSGQPFAQWPAGDRQRTNAANARIQRVESIGDAAELIAADIDALTDSYAISGFDVTTSPRWPAI